MSWSSIVSKKKENKSVKDINKKKKKIATNQSFVIDEKMECKLNFENKYDLDLYDLCFDIKDYLDKNCDLLINIESFKIVNFIKEYVNYSKYVNEKEDSDSDNEFENL